jgi:hypothetical protein
MEYERPGNGGLSNGFGLQLPAGYGQPQQPIFAPPQQQQVFQQFPAAAPRQYSGTYAPATDVSVNTPPNYIIVVNLHGGPGIHSPITLPPNIRVGYPYEPRDRCTSLYPEYMPKSLDWRSFFQANDMISKHKSYQFFSQIDNKSLSISNDIPYHVYYYIRQANNQYAMMSYLRLNKIIPDENGIDRRNVTNFNSNRINFQLKDLIANIIHNYAATNVAVIMNTCDAFDGNNTRSVYQGAGLRIFNSLNNRKRRYRLKRKNTRKNKA